MKSKVERLREMVERDPANVFARYTLAMELKKSDLPGALGIFGEIHAKHPSYVPSYYQYAKALEESGDLERARAIYATGIEAARAAGDSHAMSELSAALDLL
jgi:tetratricopeptide (TPR) repeat protein